MPDVSELRTLQKQHGAIFDEQSDSADSGPLHFGNPHFEYSAARTEAALFDFSDRTQLELTGKDRAKFLHNFCTNDVRALPAGSGCEAFVTNVQGKVLGHIFAFAGDESLFVESVPHTAERLIGHLSRYQISEDVEFHDRSPELATFFLTGPESPVILARLGVDCADLVSLQYRRCLFGEIPVHVRRNDLTRLPGYMLVVPRQLAAMLWKQFTDRGVRLAGSAAWKSLRINACFPEYGVDFTDENLAQEVNRTSTAISFSKGCYLGQEPIARIDALGHVNRQLRGIRLGSGLLPVAGCEVVSADADARTIGQITSAAISLDNDMTVALAMMRRNFDSPGLQIQVRIGTDVIPGVLFWSEK